MDLSSQVDIHFKLGLVLSRQERFADAIVYLEKTVALDPNAANAHLVLGGSLLQLNRLPEAEKSFIRAYALGGSAVASAQMFLGQLYLMQRNPEAALGAFELYLKDMPTAPNSAKIKIEVGKLRATLNKE
jgi:tetratricopeptide (TPR) repeat protein